VLSCQYRIERDIEVILSAPSRHLIMGSAEIELKPVENNSGLSISSDSGGR